MPRKDDVEILTKLYGTEDKTYFTAVGMLSLMKEKRMTIPEIVAFALKGAKNDDHYHEGIRRAGKIFEEHKEELGIK